MLCIEPCESFTQKRLAPPLAAPSMHAFASSAIHLRARSYSTPCIITWLYVATPPMPSMSTEIHTLCATRPGTARWYEVAHSGASEIELSSRPLWWNAYTPSSGGGARKGARVQVPPAAQSIEMVTPLVVAPLHPFALEL